ncbi:MFS transporter [Desulfobacula sp.]
MKINKDQSPWGLILLLFGAGILSAFQVGKVPPVLSDIRSDLVISLFYAGWVLSVFNLTGLFLGTFTGAIADAIGHRRLMLAGLVIQIAGCFLGSLSHSFYGLLASRILEGAGFLAVIVSTPTLIFQIVKKKDMSVALSIWTCYLPAGASLMMILLPFILMVTDWKGLWQINAVILIAYTLLLSKKTSHIKFINRSGSTTITKLIQDIIKTTTSAGPLLLAIIFITYALQWLAVMGFLPTLILEKYGFSKSMASILTASIVFCNIFGNLAGGRLLKRGIKRWRLITFAFIVMGLSSFAIYSSTANFILNYTGCLVFSIFGGLIPASILGGVPEYAPSKNLIATTNGLVIQGGQAGQVMGPPILAYLVSQTGSWSCGSWFLGSVALVGAMLSLCLNFLKSDRRD